MLVRWDCILYFIKKVIGITFYQNPFTFHISYAGSNDFYKGSKKDIDIYIYVDLIFFVQDMNPGDHVNYDCTCLPHDMEIQLAVSFIKFIMQSL